MILQRVLIYAALAGGLLLATFLFGYSRGEMKLFEYIADQAKARVVVIQKIERVKEIVRVEHVKRVKVIEQVFVEIEKEVPHVPVRPGCNVTAGWLRLHNAAAGARSPEGAVDDGADTGITEAGAADTVQVNYKAFHVVANHLKACRAYVTGLAEATK